MTEPAEFLILPYPVIDGGKKVAIQRGGGMCIISSDEVKEYAAGIFLKWFTAPEQNVKFVSSTGYIPVREKAIEMTVDNGDVDDKIRILQKTIKEMAEQYTFFYTPVIENFDELQESYNKNMKNYAIQCNDEYFNFLNNMNEADAFNEATKNKYEELIRQR